MNSPLPRFVLIGILIISLLTGCSATSTSDKPASFMLSNQDLYSQKELPKDQDKTLTIWAFEDNWDSMLNGFKKEHPEIDIQFKMLPYSEFVNKSMEALAKGIGPDVFLLDYWGTGAFNSTKAVDDLSLPSYGFLQYKKDFPKELWATGQTFDGKGMFAVPFATFPSINYYRSDLLEKYGFPTEPEKLATYLDNPDNYLKLARTLRQNGHYSIAWETEPLELISASIPLLDKKLNFNRKSSPELVQALNLTKEIRYGGLGFNKDIFTDAGISALQTGQLAMINVGSWGENQLMKAAPELEGKWRATRSPFRKHLWFGSWYVSISKVSKNKQKAKLFAEYLLKHPYRDGSVPGYLPEREKMAAEKPAHPYFGGQNVQHLYLDQVKYMKEVSGTPLDRVTANTWYNKIYTAIDFKQDSHQALLDAEKEVNKVIEQDRETLLKVLGSKTVK